MVIHVLIKEPFLDTKSVVLRTTSMVVKILGDGGWGGVTETWIVCTKFELEIRQDSRLLFVKLIIT